MRNYTLNHHRDPWIYLLWLCFCWPGANAHATQDSDSCQRFTRQKQYGKAARCFRGLAHKEAVEHCMEGIVNRKLADQLTETRQKRQYYLYSLQSFERCSQGGAAWKEAAERHTLEIKKVLAQSDQSKTTPQTTITPKSLATSPKDSRPQPQARRLAPNRVPKTHLHQTPTRRVLVSSFPPLPPPLTAKHSSKPPIWPWVVGIGLSLGVGAAIGVTIYLTSRPSSIIQLRVPLGS